MEKDSSILPKQRAIPMVLFPSHPEAIVGCLCIEGEPWFGAVLQYGLGLRQLDCRHEATDEHLRAWSCYPSRPSEHEGEAPQRSPKTGQ